MHRREVGVKHGRIEVMIGNGRYEQALGKTRPEQPRQEVHEMRSKELCPVVKGTDKQWEKSLKAITIGEDKAGDSLWVRGNGQLANGSPRIIAHQGNIVQIQCLQESRD